MCDVYTAGAVFDALCPKRLDVMEKAGESLYDGVKNWFVM